MTAVNSEIFKFLCDEDPTPNTNAFFESSKMAVDDAEQQKDGTGNKTRSLTPLQTECVNLLRAKQYRSCELVSMMELSRQEQSNSNTAATLEILGDCANETKQHRRAISYYRRAALQHRLNRSFGSSIVAQSAAEANLRWKEARCLSSLGSVVEASSVLELVPKRFRSLGICVTLGNLYVTSGRHTDAIHSFLDAVAQNPYALEAVEWLAVLGADRNQVLEAVEHGLTKKLASPEDESLVPVLSLVTAHFLMHRHQTATALTHFTKLEQEYPNNVYLLLKIAALQVRAGLARVCFIEAPHN